MDARGIKWDDAPGGIVWDDEEKKPPQRSTLDQLKRQAGLTLRAGAEGLAGIPGMFISPFQQAAGVRTMNQGVTSLLDRAGVPKPEGGAEEVVGAISRGLAGGGGFAGAARALPAMAGAGPATVDNILAQQAGLQTTQAGIGAGASEMTKQSGGGEVAQMIAGAVAPMGASGGLSVARAAGRGANELRRPMTRQGAEQIAADVLGSLTQDKTTAQRNLDEYLARRAGGNMGVPGSRPTAAAVSADYGTIGAEQLIARGPANPLFAERQAANNQARLDELGKLRATQDVLDRYIARRDQATSGLREQAFANAKGPVDFAPVGQRIMQLAATPAGGREESRKALSWLAQRVGRNAEEGRIDAPNAYALHQDIGDLVAGKIKDDNGSALRLAGGLAADVKRTLARQIEQAAPGFQKYLETYSRFSKPIDRLQILTDKLGGEGLTKVTTSGIMAGPEGAAYTLSADKMRRVTDNIKAALPDGPRGLNLAPYQRDVLGRVGGDLDSASLAARGGKQPGSDTYQNMATANFLRGVLGDNLANAGIPKAVTVPLNLAMRPFEARVNDIVTKAFLDPELYARLLKKARTQRAGPSLLGVTQEAERGLLGGLLGGALAQ